MFCPSLVTSEFPKCDNMKMQPSFFPLIFKNISIDKVTNYNIVTQIIEKNLHKSLKFMNPYYY